ncbi:hypothetical protein BC829DRAFT_302248 [Chytridium lagenaria]|nr:hypothetical protein BC829DRAFT_302248 [Chytridium lagenaria]
MTTASPRELLPRLEPLERNPSYPRSMTGPPPVTWMNRKTGRSRSRSTPRKRSLSDAVNPSTNTTTSQIDLVSDLEYSTINAVQRLQDIAAFLKTQGVKGGTPPSPDSHCHPKSLPGSLLKSGPSSQRWAFLSSVDDLPLLTMRDDVTIDFKFKRGVLYNCVSALVMATSNATSMLTPANVVEEIWTVAQQSIKAYRNSSSPQNSF